MALVVGVSVVSGLPSSAAKAKPNLVVTKATVDRTKVAEGDKLTVTHTVKNRGTRQAKESQTRFYLSADPAVSLEERKNSRSNPRSAPQDIRLVGRSVVAALPIGKSVALSATTLTVPIGTQPGSYTVLACADDRGKVKEKNETDNCTAASEAVAVRAPADNDTLVLQTFAETARWPDDEEFTLQYMKIFCDSAYPVQPRTLAGALASTRRFLKEKAGDDALQELAESGQADTALAAQELAAVASSQGSPGLALAAMLRAHELEPKIGSHLINIAALATSVGLPNEALAFLDASASRDLRNPAMGVSQQAIAMTVRGQALMMTGRPGPAEAMFKAAKLAEPMLSEADAGLATVEACRDNDVKAARYLRKSRQRSQEKDTTPPTEEPVRPEPVIDRTFGKESALRQLPMAETPSQAVDMYEVYKGIAQGFQGEIQAHNDERFQLEQHLQDTDDARTPAEIERRSDMLMLVYGVSQEPDVEAMQQKIFDKLDVLTLHLEEFWGGGTGEVEYTYRTLSEAASEACADARDYEACRIAELNSTCIPALNGEHSEWRVMISQLQNLSNEYFAVLSERESAYASNLLDEEAHRLALLSIEEHETALYALIVQQAQFWTHYVHMFEEECVDWQPEPPADPEDPTGASSSGPCPKAIKAMNLVATLGPSKLKVNCEKITQEISAEVIPLLHVFGEVEHTFQTGRTTVIIGSKAEAKLGVVKGGFKSGFYITSDLNGDIVDVGWRVGPSASAAGGSAEFKVSDTIDISFVPVFVTDP